MKKLEARNDDRVVVTLVDDPRIALMNRMLDAAFTAPVPMKQMRAGWTCQYCGDGTENPNALAGEGCPRSAVGHWFIREAVNGR